MLSFETLVALAAFAFVSAVTPGPNNLMMMTSGTNFGFARTGPHMAGVIFGFALMVLLVGLGVGAVFGLIPASMLVLKIVSTVYLLYLAWKIAMSAPPEIDAAQSGATPLTFLQAAAFQWVNPKGWTMALTAAAVYVPANDRVRGAAIVGLVFLVTNVPSATIWAAAGVQLRRLLHRPRAYRAINVVAALLLVASLYPVLFSGA
jgi:threonine/homoserine/homoserine lactone efflux protein